MSVRPRYAGASGSAERARWITFAVCAGAAFITTLDLSIVNVAFPEILREFEGTTRADLSWIVTVYNIFFGSFLVVAGKIADQIGRKRVFLGGVGVFAVGSTICSLAPTLGVLIVGRAVQGVGGAFMAPASLGLLLAAFPAERRTQTVAIWGGVGALGVASGPSLGALLISLTDWRAAFWINIPICLTLLVVGAVTLVETPRVPSRAPSRLRGALMVTLALAAVALGLSQSDTWGWFDPRTLGSLAVGVATGVRVRRPPARASRAGARPHPVREPIVHRRQCRQRRLLRRLRRLRPQRGAVPPGRLGLLGAARRTAERDRAAHRGCAGSARRPAGDTAWLPPVRRDRTAARGDGDAAQPVGPHDRAETAPARDVQRDRRGRHRLFHSGQCRAPRCPSCHRPGCRSAVPSTTPAARSAPCSASRCSSR